MFSRVSKHLIVLAAILAGSALAILLDDPVPEMRLVNLKGEAVTLSSLHGKPVVINFWASWCPPCKQEMPELSKLYEKYKAEGLEVIGVNVDEGFEIATAHIKGNPVSYPVWADAPAAMASTAKFDTTRAIFKELRGSGIPWNLFVRRDGTLEDTTTGFGDGFTGKIERRMKAILASPAP